MAPQDTSTWASFSPFLCVVGVLLLIASFLTPNHLVADYSEQDALQFQRVADRLHELSGQVNSSEPQLEQQRELRDTQNEFVTLKEKLESERDRGPKLRLWLRYAGFALCVGGFLMLSISRQTS